MGATTITCIMSTGDCTITTKKDTIIYTTPRHLDTTTTTTTSISVPLVGSSPRPPSLRVQAARWLLLLLFLLVQTAIWLRLLLLSFP